jgi:putative oxidoreductase
MKSIVFLLIALPAQIASYFPWIGPLIMRLVVGYVFMLTGWAKLNNLPQMIQNFSEWGIPFPAILTPFASAVECFGGAMLILGLFTRIPAAMLTVVMIVAIKAAKWENADSWKRCWDLRRRPTWRPSSGLRLRGQAQPPLTGCCCG